MSNDSDYGRWAQHFVRCPYCDQPRICQGEDRTIFACGTITYDQVLHRDNRSPDCYRGEERRDDAKDS